MSGASRLLSCASRCSSTCAAIRSRSPSTTANTYNDWFLDRPFVIVPLTEMAGKFLKTMIDYPPSATAGSFNLSKMQKQIEELSKAH